MDNQTSTKFVATLSNFLLSQCNEYIQFEKYVLVTGHLYVSVDTGEHMEYIVNEKLVKTDGNCDKNILSNSYQIVKAKSENSNGSMSQVDPIEQSTEQGEPKQVQSSNGKDGLQLTDDFDDAQHNIADNLIHFEDDTPLHSSGDPFPFVDVTLIKTEAQEGGSTSHDYQDFPISLSEIKRQPPDDPSLNFIRKRKKRRNVQTHFNMSDSTSQFDSPFDGNQKKRNKIRKPEIKKHKCEICDKLFIRPCTLELHMRQHSGEKPYTCDTCGKSYADIKVLRLHKRIHTGEKPFVCGVCGAGFGQKSSLKNHERLHSGQKAFVCELCGKSFAQPSSLKAHKMIHTDVKPFTCSECFKSFRTKKELKRHNFVHTKERPCSCEVCGKSFSTTDGLTKHKRTHLNEKPHICEFCGQKFARKEYLVCHRRYHTGEKPYSCDICGMAFRRSGDIAQHKRKFHSNVFSKENEHFGNILPEMTNQSMSSIKDGSNSVFPDTINQIEMNLKSENPRVFPEMTKNIESLSSQLQI